MRPLRFVFLGLSITSSWGNGHATTYRALVRELARLGHDVLFLERDVPWYAENRDQPARADCRIELYRSTAELERRFAAEVREADAVIVGSYVPEGVAVGRFATDTARGLTAFYDIDTPVTLAKLERGDEEYLSRDLVSRFDLYLSFTGGPVLRRLERELGARRAAALYCSVDAECYRPLAREPRFDLGYLGTYGADRQPTLEELLLEPARRAPARRFAVAGPQYPAEIRWPANVERLEHVPPAAHAEFYAAQRFTLNVTRADMRRAGWSPSVRLFEAGACGVAILSDDWPGLDELLEPGREILVVASADEVAEHLERLGERERRAIGERARARILAEHTSAHRARELVAHVLRPPRAHARAGGERAGAPVA